MTKTASPNWAYFREGQGLDAFFCRQPPTVPRFLQRFYISMPHHSIMFSSIIEPLYLEILVWSSPVPTLSNLLKLSFCLTTLRLVIYTNLVLVHPPVLWYKPPRIKIVLLQSQPANGKRGKTKIYNAIGPRLRLKIQCKGNQQWHPTIMYLKKQLVLIFSILSKVNHT
jgi:hypothetical protein